MIQGILENDEWCLTGEEELIAHQRAGTKLAKVQRTQKEVALRVVTVHVWHSWSQDAVTLIV